jgi:hypothetical protein
MKINVGGVKGAAEFKGVGWKIMDIAETADFIHDLNSISKFELDDSSVDAFYTSHTLEHILPEYQNNTFAELYRTLKKGSKIRIVVPDVEKAIKAYADGDYEFLLDSRNPGKMGSLPDDPLCYLSSWFFTYYSEEKSKRVGRKPFLGGHVMSFNFNILQGYLETAGFQDICRCSFNEKSEVFKGCDIHRYKDNSIFVEAIK